MSPCEYHSGKLHRQRIDRATVRLCLLRALQRGDPVIARKVVVGDDEIERFPRQRGFETVLTVYQNDVTGHALDLQLLSNHLGVPRAIFQVEHSEWTCHVWSHASPTYASNGAGRHS
jgi:hypothetical protein